MTITRIISGGQIGADRGGLDAAIKLGIPHGGWCPAGRRSENGRIPERYQLEEAPAGSYPVRTRLNVRDSDGTVIFTVGPITRGSALTLHEAGKLGREVKHIDLEMGLDRAAEALREWLGDCEQFGNPVRTLNVAGSRQSLKNEIQEKVCDVICLALKEG